MTCLYCLHTDKETDDEGEEHAVYGIDAYGQEQGQLRLLYSIRDVFCDRRDAEDLVIRCNILELNPVHLQDVIEDALV